MPHKAQTGGTWLHIACWRSPASSLEAPACPALTPKAETHLHNSPIPHVNRRKKVARRPLNPTEKPGLTPRS